MDFCVVSWNMATYRDFQKMAETPLIDVYTDTEAFYDMDFTKEEDQEKLRNMKKALTQTIFERLIPVTQLFLLQETQLSVRKYLPESYTVVDLTAGGPRDIGMACIAFSNEHFKMVKQFPPILEKEIPIERATTKSVSLVLEHKSSGASLLVTSAHLTGCYDIHRHNDDAKDGTKELQLLLNNIDAAAKIYGCDGAIFGLDANVAPDHPRLSLLDKHSYTYFPKELVTNYSTYSQRTGDGEALRTLDYIGYRSFDSGEYVVSGKDLPDNILNAVHVELGNPSVNPSDHKPIAGVFSFEKRPTLFGKIVAWLRSW